VGAADVWPLIKAPLTLALQNATEDNNI
jgi:hypothetical protein